MIRSFIVFCLLCVHFAKAEENKCTTEKTEEGKKRLCFFALNGPQESEAVAASKAGLNCIRPEDGASIKCSSETKEGAAVDLEIQEFYADVKSNESVSRAFEKMSNTACDGLVISGHHVGYYTGEQTSQERDERGHRKASKVTLNLRFLERLSCLQGGEDSNCRQWFSNIKYLHLHGSHTSGDKVLKTENDRTEKIINTTDDLALSRMENYRPEVWTRASAQYLNREYASTVDENNSLSSRYLKMFPSAQIYSWAVARTIEQGSPQTFIDHLKLMAAHTSIAKEKDTVSEAAKGLENILNILSISESEPKCIKLTDSDRQGTLIQSISNPETENHNREIGCDFSETIESKDKDKIIKALDQVLTAGALQENLNRIFYALNYDSPLGADVKQAIQQKLKASPQFQEALEKQAENKQIGVVKRADALYLYKQIYPEIYRSGGLENQLVEDLGSLYDRQGDNTVGRAMKGMIAELIWKNNLGSSPASQNNIQSLMGKLNADGNDIYIRQHAELMRISSDLAEESKVKEIFEELFALEKNNEKSRDSWFFIKTWTDLQIQNGGSLQPLQEMYSSHQKAYEGESDSVRKEELNTKLTDIIAGVSNGFAVRKEECVKDEFPLSADNFQVTESDREWMVQVWKESCNKS